ncbi:MAG TPA: hypothetical protein VJ225_07090, partial [Nitrososphaeraceae archaeon]|nr:hypothetical protein [Nitrososphaeraceae archaeon]
FGDNTLHGGKGEDTFVSSGSDTTTYIGGQGADNFVCGPGTDTITDFNAAEGDTKTADCENVLEESESALNNNNDNNANITETATHTSTPTSEVAEDSSATEEDASSLPSTTTPSSSSNNAAETIEATGTADIQKTIDATT